MPLKLTQLIVMSALLLSFKSWGNDLAVFRIGPDELGHCTGFHLGTTDYANTAAHCLKNNALALLTSSPTTLATDQQAFHTGPLGIYDRGFFHAGSLINEDYQFNTAEISQLADYIIIGFPEFRRHHSPTIFLCHQVHRNQGLNQDQIESTLGTIHLSCPNFLNEVGEVVDATNLRHRDVRGLSGGAAISRGEVVGVAYHFDDRNLIYKVQTPTADQTILGSQQTWQRYRLDRSIFEEVKIPNAVNIAIDLLLMSNAIALRDRERLEWSFDGDALHLETQEYKKSIPASQLSWILRTYLAAPFSFLLK